MKRYTINRIFAHLVGNISAPVCSIGFSTVRVIPVTEFKIFSEMLDFGRTVAYPWQPVHALNGLLHIHRSAYIPMNGISDDHCWRVLYECQAGSDLKDRMQTDLSRCTANFDLF